MAERFRNGQNRLNMYFGTLLWSDVPHSQIKEIRYPDLDDRFILIDEEDIPGDNRLSILGASMPVLSKKHVGFVHQPILAIFGPDYESVTIAARETEITYAEESEDDNESLDLSHLPDPLILSWGDSTAKSEEVHIISTSYTSKRIEAPAPLLITCNAWYEGGKIHIEVPSLWPELIRKTTAEAMAFPENNVIVHPLPCVSRHDEYLLMPAYLAVITAAAVIKTGISVEMKVLTYNTSPEITVKRTTWCTLDGRPEGEEVVMSVDQGFAPIAAQEVQRQAMAGLIPYYPLDYFNAKVELTSSYNPPSAFFGTLGFSEALASVEYHSTKIADELGINPKQWKAMVTNGRRKFTDFLPSIDFAPLSQLEDEIARESDFNRKWSSYESQKGDMSLIPFSRGIGMASGVSISGFSSTFSRDSEFHAKITLTEKNNITINTSFQTTDNTAAVYKKLVTQEMDFTDDNDVIVLDKDSNSIDSGPDVLNRSVGKFPKQLVSGCRKILLQKRSSRPPISEIIDTDDKLSPCEFDTSGTMAIAVEIRTDNISFQPIVHEVWAAVTVGHIFNGSQFKAKLADAILTSLSDAGAVFARNASRPFSIHITLHEDNTETIASLDEAAKGLARAAFASALSQAAPHIDISYPVSPAAIESAINFKGDKT